MALEDPSGSEVPCTRCRRPADVLVPSGGIIGKVLPYCNDCDPLQSTRQGIPSQEGLSSEDHEEGIPVRILEDPRDYRDASSPSLKETLDVRMDLVPEEKEAVNHPLHYGGENNELEHVKVAEALGWVDNAFIYNVTKYLWRAGHKESSSYLEDLRKAQWYLNRAIQLEERRQDED